MSASPVSFLDLPRELRDMCYDEHLRTPQSSSKEASQAPGFAFRFLCAILLVNRQIHHEARQFIYRANPLTLDIAGVNEWGSPCQVSARMIETFKRSSIRPMMEDFVLSVTLAHPTRKHATMGTYHPTVPHIYTTAARELAAAVALMVQRPLIRSLKIVFQTTHRPPARNSRRTTMLMMDVMNLFGPLLGRVTSVTIHSDWPGKSLAQLNLLCEKLQVLRCRDTSFLGLSQEVRQLCYSYMLSRRSRARFACRNVKGNNDLRFGSPAHTFPTALFRTCHQLHDEATTYLYSHIKLPLIVPSS